MSLPLGDNRGMPKYDAVSIAMTDAAAVRACSGFPRRG
jgi:hypothetical protein